LLRWALPLWVLLFLVVAVGAVERGVGAVDF